MQNTDTTKYIIHSKISADGIIERPDIVGAVFGQTEGLLGSDLDLRDLQKTGRIGRIEVIVTAKGGKTKGTILVPSSLDKVETSILAASLETIDRVGPCSAKIEVNNIEDVRATKRKQIIERAKFILTDMFDTNLPESQEIAEEVRQSVRIEEMQYFGKNKIPCGPAVFDSDAIIVVEGRADVLNLLRYGIKNTICVGGTNVPPEVAEFTKKKETVTAFTDGDRGGELIIKELLQVANIDYIARAPDGKSVEDLVQKEIVRSLRQKIPVEQIIDKYSLKDNESGKSTQIARIPKQKGRYVEIPRVVPANKLKKRPIKQREISTDNSYSQLEETIGINVKSPASIKYKSHAEQLLGTFGARFLDPNDNIIEETAVRDVVNNLRNHEGTIRTVVFDGVITQRIIDIAENKGIEYLIGTKIGSIVKRPISVKIMSIKDM